ncbi:MAG TPA: hypothetical protein EYH56_02555 [Nanoarchaeota archaeon]|nr:hypothetical protein [Nanoarchaeota archaeon]
MIREIQDLLELQFLRKINIYLDHCKRAQKNEEDIEKNKGIILKVKEKLYGKLERTSQFSPICHECYHIISDLLTFTEINSCFSKYKEDIEKIQQYCIDEKCKEAYTLMEKVKEKFLNSYKIQEYLEKQKERDYYTFR